MSEMSDFIQKLEVGTGTAYEIKVKGQIAKTWSDWFNTMTITNQNGITVMHGVINDQSELHGILLRILDFNLKLLSVECIDLEDKEVVADQ